MISIIGIGNAASNIAELFKSTNNYAVYRLNSSVKRSSKYQYRLKSFETPEEYENNIPDLQKFFKEVSDHAQVFMVGSSFSSNYTLGILQQIADKKIDLFYIKPDSELLTGVPKLIENAVFGVLQEYARSGVFNSFTVISNLEIEKSLDKTAAVEYINLEFNSTAASKPGTVSYWMRLAKAKMNDKPIDQVATNNRRSGTGGYGGDSSGGY